MNAFLNTLKNLFSKKPVLIAATVVAVLVICLVCAFALRGCSTEPEATLPATTGTTVPATEDATEDTTEAATNAVVQYRNPLTGEPMDAAMTARPFAVMLNNYESALPIHGNSEADIIYEALTEGGMTRCMGIYTDLAASEELGSIRSARRHFANLSLAYDAIYVHYGKSTGNVGAEEYMNAMDIDHMDGTAKGYPYFYESQERIDDGYNPGDACHFLVGQRAIDYAKDNGFVLDRGKALDYGMQFDDDKVIVGKTANTITVWFNQGGTPGSWTKYTKLTYDKQSKQYASYQFGEDNIDGNTGETVSFRNVLILKAPTRKNDSSEHMIINLEGSGEGYFACNGQLVPIKWSRASATDPFTYTLEDGTPLTFGVGKTYIGIVPTNNTTEWE